MSFRLCFLTFLLLTSVSSTFAANDHISIRVSDELSAKIDAETSILRQQYKGYSLTRSDTLRICILEALTAPPELFLSLLEERCRSELNQEIGKKTVSLRMNRDLLSKIESQLASVIKQEGRAKLRRGEFIRMLIEIGLGIQVQKREQKQNTKPSP